MEEQQRRFQDRIDDERKRWKLSPMDKESYNRWYDYSRARDAMFEATDTDDAPWFIVPSDNKKRVTLGKRDLKGKYDDESVLLARHFVPAEY